jgi:hypothetical protein
MKSVPAMIIALCVTGFAGEIPQELKNIVMNPPMLEGKGFQVPKDSGAIIKGEGYVSLITLEEAENDGCTTGRYQFRTYSTIHKIEVRGEGTVMEKYYRIAAPGQKGGFLVDKGSQLQIDAGLFKVQWSLSRWIYAGKKEEKNEDVTIQAGSEEEYLKWINHQPKLSPDETI